MTTVKYSARETLSDKIRRGGLSCWKILNLDKSLFSEYDGGEIEEACKLLQAELNALDSGTAVIIELSHQAPRGKKTFKDPDGITFRIEVPDNSKQVAGLPEKEDKATLELLHQVNIKLALMEKETKHAEEIRLKNEEIKALKEGEKGIDKIFGTLNKHIPNWQGLAMKLLSSPSPIYGTPAQAINGVQETDTEASAAIETMQGINPNINKALCNMAEYARLSPTDFNNFCDNILPAQLSMLKGGDNG